MKIIRTQLSDETAKLVEDLLRNRGVFNLFGSPSKSLAETIAQIEASGEVAAIPFLALFALDVKASLRNRAAQAAKTLLKLTSNDLLNFDQSIRRLYGWTSDHGKKWINIKPSQLSALSEISTAPEALTGILSFHQNGHVREAAVKLLANLQTGSELPFLLIRLNDWVPSVRTAARQAIQARMRPHYAHLFAANITLLHRLMSWERVNHSVFLGWILEYLRTPECSGALNELLNSPDSKTRRLTYRLLARPDNEQLRMLLHRALKDRDPAIRAWSIAQARQQLQGEVLQDIACKGIKDKYAGVRSHAAYIYAESLTDESLQVLKSLLMDPAPGLRSIGRYYLGKSEPMDFGLFYRTRVESKSINDTVTAIRGLSEVGHSSDADLLASCSIHPNHKIRAAAMCALDKLDGDRFVGQFVEAMLDASPSVSKMAARALSKRAALIDQDLLWAEYQKHSSITKKKRILTVLFSTSKWDSLYYALSVLGDAEHVVISMAQTQISQWIWAFNRSGVQPTKQQHERVLATLAANVSALPHGTEKEIKFLAGQ